MRRRVAMGLVASALLAGCAFNSGDPVVDGWPVGPEVACVPEARCPEYLETAKTGLDRRDPGHPAVVMVTLHDEGSTVDSFGNHILPTRSGPRCLVARFTLADTSVKAIGVGAAGVDPTLRSIDYGP